MLAYSYLKGDWLQLEHPKSKPHLDNLAGPSLKIKKKNKEKRRTGAITQGKDSGVSPMNCK